MCLKSVSDGHISWILAPSFRPTSIPSLDKHNYLNFLNDRIMRKTKTKKLEECFVNYKLFNFYKVLLKNI